MSAEDPARWATTGGKNPPVPADRRPHQERRAARLLVVDDRDRVLLFEDTDLGTDPVTHWWMIPGGGVDDGESDLRAAVRELREETGLQVPAAEVRGPIGERVVVHGYSDIVVTQTEPLFVVHTPAFEVDIAGHTADERLTVTRHHWFTREELATTTDDVWPRDLLSLWELALSPERWPVDLGRSEESTVPAGDQAEG